MTSRTTTTPRLSSGSRPTRRAAGAVGTLEASRVIVGPQCGLGFEIYGTEGSASWNFEQMNELQACHRPHRPQPGLHDHPGQAPRRATTPHFQPGPGNSMGYDDLKVIEAKKFLVAVTGGEQRNSTIEEALADAEVIAAAAASAVDGQWHQVPHGCRAPPSATAAAGVDQCLTVCRWWSGSGWSTRPGRPACSTGTAGSSPNPTDDDLRWRSGAIARADAVVDTQFFEQAPRLRVVARTGVGVERVDLDAATARGIAVVVTPGSGTHAVAEGRHRDGHAPGQAVRPADRRWSGPASGPTAARSPSATSTGAILGVVGYGRIGQRAGALGAALGMTVLAYDPVSAAAGRRPVRRTWRDSVAAAT